VANSIYRISSNPRMVFTRSGAGGYPSPQRRRRTLSPTQFRFLYPATPLTGVQANTPVQRQTMQGQQASPAPQQTTAAPQATPAQRTLQIQPMQQLSPIPIQTSTPAASQQIAPVVSSPIDPTQVSTALLYQGNKPLTPQQQALLSQIPTTQENLVIPSHHAALNNTGALTSVRTAPMRPMDVAKECFLDYVSPQSIKFYNKAIEHLSR
jgi:hypothetical protein